MSGTITKIKNRHDEQGAGDPDLVIEVGQPLPAFYQRPGHRVVRIQDRDPLRVILDDGQVVLVGRQAVTEIDRS